MKWTYIAILAALLLGCNTKRNEDVLSGKIDTNSSKSKIVREDHPQKSSDNDGSYNTQRGNEINLYLDVNGDSGFIKGHLDSAGALVTCYLNIPDPGKLVADIETNDGPANIRFNKIIFPDKDSDGPFGKDLDYDLSQKGKYEIVIGQNLMAENAYIGEFLLHFQLR